LIKHQIVGSSGGPVGKLRT